MFLYSLGDICPVTKQKRDGKGPVRSSHPPPCWRAAFLPGVDLLTGETGGVCSGTEEEQQVREKLCTQVTQPAQLQLLLAAIGFCSKRAKTSQLDILGVVGAFSLTCCQFVQA